MDRMEDQGWIEVSGDGGGLERGVDGVERDSSETSFKPSLFLPFSPPPPPSTAKLRPCLVTLLSATGRLGFTEAR